MHNIRFDIHRCDLSDRRLDWIARLIIIDRHLSNCTIRPPCTRREKPATVKKVFNHALGPGFGVFNLPITCSS